MKSSSRPTIIDIAKQAGVSRSTVSRVLNNEPYIKAEVRQRVLDVISQTGYTPNSMAQGLRSRKSNSICVLLPNLRDAFANDVSEYITNALHIEGYSCSLRLNIKFSGREMLGFNDAYDGVVLIPEDKIDETISDFLGELEQRFRTVVIDSHGDNLIIQSANMAAGHLLDLGHEYIGVISASSEASYEQGAFDTLLLTGIREAYLHRDVYANDKVLLYRSSESAEAGYVVAKELLQEAPHVTAFIVSNAAAAFGVLEAAATLGMNIPNELSVIAIADIPSELQPNLSLTTISRDVMRTGVAVVESLFDQLERSELPISTVQPGIQLVPGKTTGKPQD
jgi:LacI family transcriptional regulator